jgi:hypothetical protein
MPEVLRAASQNFPAEQRFRTCESQRAGSVVFGSYA